MEGFVHRDLKPENIIFSSKEDDAIVKVIDFGLSVQIKKKLHETIGTVIFTLNLCLNCLALLHGS